MEDHNRRSPQSSSCSSPLCRGFGGSVCVVPPRKPRRFQRAESRGAIYVAGGGLGVSVLTWGDK